MKRKFFGSLIFLAAVLGSVSAQQQEADKNPKKTMTQAHASMLAGHDDDALKLYEAIAASQSRDAAKYKADALYNVALIRLSASTPDPAGAGTALNELTKSYPTSEHRLEAAALTRSLQQIQELSRRAKEADDAKQATQDALTAKTTEAAEYQARVTELSKELESTRGQIDNGKSDATRTRREVTTLQAENRNLRDQVVKLQAELDKKDQALRKIAGSIVR